MSGRKASRRVHGATQWEQTLEEVGVTVAERGRGDLPLRPNRNKEFKYFKYKTLKDWNHDHWSMCLDHGCMFHQLTIKYYMENVNTNYEHTHLQNRSTYEISTVTTKRRLTLGLFILAWGPPADAGLVLVQIEEAHQSLGATAELHHLGPQLHGAHTFFHCRQETKADRRKKRLERCQTGSHWSVTDKNLYTIQHTESMCSSIPTKIPSGPSCKTLFCTHTLTWTHKWSGYACHCKQAFVCPLGGREMERK